MAIKVGFIGTGGISRGHLTRMNENPSAQVVALCDVDTETMKERSKLLDGSVEFYNDYGSMLEEEDLDAAVICTPHTLHFQQIMDCLDRGIHVLTEKPMVCTVERAEKVIAKAEETGKVLMVRYQRHYNPAFRWAHDYIRDGKFGKMFFISANLGQNWARVTHKTWRGRKELSGGGMLMDSGSHIVDVVCWLAQVDPVEVQAMISNEFARDEEVDILSSLSIRFANGAIASIAVDGNSPKWHESMTISGSVSGGEAMIEFGRASSPEPVLTTAGGEAQKVEKLPEPHSADDNFIAVIQGKEVPLSTAHDALKVIKVTEAAYLSDKEGRTVKMNQLG